MSTNYLTSSSSDYGFPTLSGLGIGSSSAVPSSSGISSLLDGLGSITGSPSNSSGANENFLYDIGSSSAPSASNGYNFGSGSGLNSLISSSNNFLNNTINSSIEQGIISPSDFSLNQLSGAANTSGSTPSFLSSLGQGLSSVEGGLSSLTSGVANLFNPITTLLKGQTAYASPKTVTGGFSTYNLQGQPVSPQTGVAIPGAPSVATGATTNYSPYIVDGVIVIIAGILFIGGLRLIENM